MLWILLAMPVLALPAPATAAVPATLYADVAGGQGMALSVVPPPQGYTVDTATDGFSHTMTCLPSSPAWSGEGFHTWHAYPAGGQVQEGEGRSMPTMRGFRQDLWFEIKAEPILHWYLALEASPEAGLPAAAPWVVVEAVVVPGPRPGVKDEGYGTSDPVAEGRSKRLLVPGQPGHSRVEGTDVYHFEVPLSVSDNVVPTEYHLRIDAYLDDGLCAGREQALMPDVVTVHSSDGHRPRLELEVAQRIRIETMHLQAFEDKWVLHVQATPLLDVGDIAAVEATLAGPQGPVGTWLLYGPEGITLHGGSEPPFPGSWVFAADLRELPPGRYQWNVTAFDHDGHPHTAQATFDLMAEGRASPGTAPVAAALALMARALLTRRRRHKPQRFASRPSC